jgi:hypothetical protein
MLAIPKRAPVSEYLTSLLIILTSLGIPMPFVNRIENRKPLYPRIDGLTNRPLVPHYS